MNTYKILRFHKDKPSEVIKRGLTLEQAQAHCSSSEVSWTNLENVGFDGYYREFPTGEEPLTAEQKECEANERAE